MQPPELQFEPLYDEVVTLFVGRASPLVRSARLGWDAIRDETLIGPLTEPPWAEILVELKQQGLAIKRQIDLHGPEGVKRLVAAGGGVGILFDTALRQELQDGQLCALSLQARLRSARPVWSVASTPACRPWPSSSAPSSRTDSATVKSPRREHMPETWSPEWSNAVFSLEERDRRWARVRELMARDGIDVIVCLPCSNNHDRGQADARYLTQLGENSDEATVVFPLEGEVFGLALARRRVALVQLVHRQSRVRAAAPAARRSSARMQAQPGFERGTIGIAGAHVVAARPRA